MHASHRLAVCLAGAILSTGAGPRPGLAREPQPQLHELQGDVGIQIGNLSNESSLGLRYTLSPAALNRWDEELPALRRFVRHPSAVWAEVTRVSAAFRETRTALVAGGVVEIAGGRASASAEAGLDWVEVTYDPNEDAYFGAPLAIGLGGRPLPLLHVRALYRFRPVLGATEDEIVPATRAGHEQEAGLAVTAATPSSRVLAEVSARWWRADWTFEGAYPGPLDASGLRADAQVSLQSSARTSWIVRGSGRLEDWVNGRPVDATNLVGEETDRQVIQVEGGLGLLYWHRGKTAFRVDFAGGFETPPPVYYRTFSDLDANRGFTRLGVGFVTRY